MSDILDRTKAAAIEAAATMATQGNIRASSEYIGKFAARILFHMEKEYDNLRRPMLPTGPVITQQPYSGGPGMAC